MGIRFSNPALQMLDGNGDPYAGGKLYFYETGTSTPLDSYSDNALSSANANPVVADSDGRFGDIFLKPQDYKAILKSSADVTIWTADPVHGQILLVTGTVADNDLLTYQSSSKTYVPETAQEAGLLKQGRRSKYIPVEVMVPTVTAGCAALATVETTAGRPDMRVLDFNSTGDEGAGFSHVFEKAYNLGTVTFRAFWTTAGAVSTGVAVGLEAIAVSNDGTIDQAFGTPAVVTDDALGAAEDVMVTAESGALTIGGTPASGDIVFFRVFRDVSDGNDDMTQDMRLLGLELFYTCNAADDT